CAVVEKRWRVVAGQTGGLRDRIAGQALEMAALDEEDVIDQLANRGMTARRLHRHFHGRGIEEQPASPLLTFVVRIAQELVEFEMKGHDCQRRGSVDVVYQAACSPSVCRAASSPTG